MEIVESFHLAWRAIRGHRLRSALTTLGVVIGVAAVILFVTLGASLQAAIIQEIRGEREPSLTVIAAPQDAGLQALLQGGSPVFTEADVRRLRAIPGVTAVSSHDPITTRGIATQTIVYSDTFDPPPALRTFFFPVNRTIRFDSREINVILPSNTSIPATVSGRIDITSINERVRVSVITHFAPATDQLRSVGQQRYSRLTVEAASYQQLPEVRRRTKQFLQTRSDARRFMPDSYEFMILSNEQLVKRVNDIVGTITSYIVGVALISWLVGSVGIINIMLVSVTERTQSIGIMKAVGAKNRDILQIFLVEAIILGVAGAALGTLVGGLGGAIATWWLDLPLVFRLRWVGFAVLSGIVVGAIAGVYPAWRAARTDPIEALRYG